MNYFRTGSMVVLALISAAACGSEQDAQDAQVLREATLLDLEHVKNHPTEYQWFDFRPNVKKLILAGAAETEHVAILWYTVTDGGVGLHYHSKTESVYVIDGTQTDGKGVYGNDTIYFNPPGSGHQITKSSGFFLLSYAAPPDFTNTSLIGEYMPVRIATGAPDLTTQYPFETKQPGVRVYAPPLDGMGGLRSEFLEITSSEEYVFKGNYLLVLKGSCDIQGLPFVKNTVAVPKTTVPQSYKVRATAGSACLAMGVSF